MIETLVDLYRTDESNIHEHILSAINMLIDENPTAIKQAKENGNNVVLIDTAGRLAIDEQMMNEIADLKKAFVPFLFLFCLGGKSLKRRKENTLVLHGQHFSSREQLNADQGITLDESTLDGQVEKRAIH